MLYSRGSKGFPSHPKTQTFFLNPPKREISSPMGKRKRVRKVRETKTRLNPQIMLMGVGKEKKKVKFPCKLCQEDHLTHQFPLIDQAQKLIKNQQPAVLKDPFSQGQNAASVSNVVGSTSNAHDQNYINMVRS